MKYRADIDGLRAIAVLSVVLFHLDFTAFEGGFVGVDVFFVISGYLITSIIKHKYENQDFKLADFYTRRIRRMVPPLIPATTVPRLRSWTRREHMESLLMTGFLSERRQH